MCVTETMPSLIPSPPITFFCAPGTAHSITATHVAATIELLRAHTAVTRVCAPCARCALPFAISASTKAWDWMKACGHDVNDPCPALFTMDVAEVKGTAGIERNKDAHNDAWLQGLAGLSIPNACTRLVDVDAAPRSTAKAKRAQRGAPVLPQQMGPVLITHKGFSGPAVLRLSSFAARSLRSLDYRCELGVNFFGGNSRSDIKRQLKDSRTRHASKLVSTFCPVEGAPVATNVGAKKHDSATAGGESTSCWRMPKRMWTAVLERAGIGTTSDTEEVRWSQLSNSDVDELVAVLTDSRFHVTGKGTFKDEFVTCGGVALKEVNMKTMESRRVPGLHFAGEVLDIDGVTGGFNFQSCWTTGYIAGAAIAGDVASLAISQ